MPKRPLSATERRLAQIKKSNPKILKVVRVKTKPKKKRR